jgi:hypothetical protein
MITLIAPHSHDLKCHSSVTVTIQLTQKSKERNHECTRAKHLRYDTSRPRRSVQAPSIKPHGGRAHEEARKECNTRQENQ